MNTLAEIRERFVVEALANNGGNGCVFCGLRHLTDGPNGIPEIVVRNLIHGWESQVK